MSETVRDAVFGNVGTMISFRVSADDSPILAKQFEPQFEPNDLLQMHNRHFIINMVINGEKTPAFSATTLTLPPQQADNTSRIIENTRRQYSRPRAEVEAEISAAIQPPEHLKKPAPQGTGAINWPLNAHTQVVTPTPPPAPTSSLLELPLVEDGPIKPTEAIGSATPKKRKRTRTRKKKTPATADASKTE